MTQQAPALDPIESSNMTLMEHLQELRVRLMWIAGGLIGGTLLSMIFAEQILIFIKQPLGDELLQNLGPTDGIAIFFKVSFAMGAAIAMPIIVYQIIAFAAPGLYPHEKRLLMWILPGIMILFLIGAAFAYGVLLPPAINFLQGFLPSVFRTEWTGDKYIGFVTRITFWIGAAFETPLVVAFLSRAGFVTGKRLLGFWRHSFVVVAIVAAAITPTIDPINMTIVMLPLMGLYFFSVGVAYLVYRPREIRDFSDDLKQDTAKPTASASGAAKKQIEKKDDAKK